MAANICPHLHSFTSCPHTPPPLHTRPPVPPSHPRPAQPSPPHCPEFIHDSLRLSGAAVLLGRMLLSCVSVPVNRVLGAQFSSSSSPSDHLFVGLVPSFGERRRCTSPKEDGWLGSGEVALLHAPVWLCPSQVMKWLSSLFSFIRESFWWRQCSGPSANPHKLLLGSRSPLVPLQKQDRIKAV